MKILMENVLISKSIILTLDKQELIYQENAPALHVFCLKKGLVITYKQHERFGKLWLSLVRPGQILGVSSLTKPLYEHSAIVLEESELVSIPVSQIHEMIENEPLFKLKLMQELCLEINRTEQRGIEYYNKTIKQKIAFLLLELFKAKAEQQAFSGGLAILPAFITEFTGINLSKVEKTLQELAYANLVRLESRMIQVTNPQALESVFRG